MLSNISLKRALRRDVSIYPFPAIEGASFDLTSSKYAWILSTKARAEVKNDEEKEIISIPPRDTMIMLTAEAISVSKKYAGIAKVRVTQACKGILSSTSPLKPGFHGRLVVAMYNSTDEPIDIILGEGIVVIMLFRLKKSASIEKGNGTEKRLALLPGLGYKLSPELQNEIYCDAYLNADEIQKSMKREPKYQEFKRFHLNSHVVFSFLLFVACMVFSWLIIQQDPGYHIGDLLLIPLWSLFITKVQEDF